MILESLADLLGPEEEEKKWAGTPVQTNWAGEEASESLAFHSRHTAEREAKLAAWDASLPDAPEEEPFYLRFLGPGPHWGQIDDKLKRQTFSLIGKDQDEFNASLEKWRVHRENWQKRKEQLKTDQLAYQNDGSPDPESYAKALISQEERRRNAAYQGEHPIHGILVSRMGFSAAEKIDTTIASGLETRPVSAVWDYLAGQWNKIFAEGSIANYIPGGLPVAPDSKEYTTDLRKAIAYSERSRAIWRRRDPLFGSEELTRIVEESAGQLGETAYWMGMGFKVPVKAGGIIQYEKVGGMSIMSSAFAVKGWSEGLRQAREAGLSDEEAVGYAATNAFHEVAEMIAMGGLGLGGLEQSLEKLVRSGLLVNVVNELTEETLTAMGQVANDRRYGIEKRPFADALWDREKELLKIVPATILGAHALAPVKFALDKWDAHASQVNNGKFLAKMAIVKNDLNRMKRGFEEFGKKIGDIKGKVLDKFRVRAPGESFIKEDGTEIEYERAVNELLTSPNEVAFVINKDGEMFQGIKETKEGSPKRIKFNEETTKYAAEGWIFHNHPESKKARMSTADRRGAAKANPHALITIAGEDIIVVTKAGGEWGNLPDFDRLARSKTKNSLEAHDKAVGDAGFNIERLEVSDPALRSQWLQRMIDEQRNAFKMRVEDVLEPGQATPPVESEPAPQQPAETPEEEYTLGPKEAEVAPQEEPSEKTEAPEITPPQSLAELEEQIIRSSPANIGKQKAKALGALARGVAKYKGMTPDEYVQSRFTGVVRGGEVGATAAKAVDSLNTLLKRDLRNRTDVNEQELADYIDAYHSEQDFDDYMSEALRYINDANKADKSVKFMHRNRKVMLSVDFDTNCPYKEMGSECVYCYVAQPRIIEEITGKPTGAAKAVVEAVKLTPQNVRVMIGSMPDHLVQFINTRMGGLRVHSFSDFRAKNIAIYDALFEAGAKKGLNFKVITKQQEFVDRYKNHKNVFINISADFDPAFAKAFSDEMVQTVVSQARTQISRAPSIAEAKSWAGRRFRKNVNIRYVPVTRAEALMAANHPDVDVVTMYHGQVREKLLKVWQTQRPDMFKRLGPDFMRRLADEFQAPKPEAFTGRITQPELDSVFGPGVVSEATFANRARNKFCCQTGKCGTCRVTCGFTPIDILTTLGKTIDGNPKASVEFDTDGRALIRALKATNVADMAHELGHVFRRDLSVDDLQTAEQWSGVEDGIWTLEAEEKFALGFERYLAEGKAPTPALKRVFEQFKKWLLEIYNQIAGSEIDIEISQPIREVFDRLVSGVRGEPATGPKDFISELANPDAVPSRTTFEKAFEGEPELQQMLKGQTEKSRKVALKEIRKYKEAAALVQEIHGNGDAIFDPKRVEELIAAEEQIAGKAEGEEAAPSTKNYRQILGQYKRYLPTINDENVIAEFQTFTQNDPVKLDAVYKTMTATQKKDKGKLWTPERLGDAVAFNRSMWERDADGIDWGSEVGRDVVAGTDVVKPVTEEQASGTFFLAASPANWDFPSEYQLPNQDVMEALRESIKPLPDSMSIIGRIFDRRWLKSLFRVHTNVPEEPFKGTPQYAHFKELFRLADEMAQYGGRMAENLLRQIVEDPATGETIDYMDNRILGAYLNFNSLLSQRDFAAANNLPVPSLRWRFNDWQELQGARDQYWDAIQKTPNLVAALDRRVKLTQDIVDKLIRYGRIPDVAMNNTRDYMHFQVRAYQGSNKLKAEISRRKKGSQRSREYGTNLNIEALDPSISYVDAELEWLAEAFIAVRQCELVDRFKSFSRATEARQLAKQLTQSSGQLTTMEQVVKYRPEFEGWECYAPPPGHILFPAHTITDKMFYAMIDDFLQGGRMNYEDYTKTLLAWGKGETMVLPSEVVSELRLRENPRGAQAGVEHLMEAWRKNVRFWKKRMLFGPDKTLAYFLRNALGDLEAMYTGRPEAVGELIPALKEVINLYRGKPMSADMQRALKAGVLGAGYAVYELGGLDHRAGFRRLFITEGGPIKRMTTEAKAAWDWLQKAHEIREATTRYAVFKRDLKALRRAHAEGKPWNTYISYAASRPSQINAIAQLMSPEDAIAKISRDLIGDYGNISQMGRWLREVAVPFWSFTELNVRRYATISHNILYDMATQMKSGGMPTQILYNGVKASLLPLPILTRMFLWQASMWVWNNLIGDDEEKLSYYDKYNPHITFHNPADPDNPFIFRNPSALGELVELFGLGRVLDVYNYYGRGEMTFEECLGEWAREVGRGGLERLGPEKQFWMELQNRGFDNIGETLMNIYGVDQYVHAAGQATGLGTKPPRKGAMLKAVTSGLLATSIGIENASWNLRDHANRWMKHYHSKEFENIRGYNPKWIRLKKACKPGQVDKEMFRRIWEEIRNEPGDDNKIVSLWQFRSNLRKSARTITEFVPRRHQREFEKSLPPDLKKLYPAVEDWLGDWKANFIEFSKELEREEMRKKRSG